MLYGIIFTIQQINRKHFQNASYVLFHLLFLLLCFAHSIGQTDSTETTGFAGVRGMWQTGNLSQISLMPNVMVSQRSPNHYAEVLGTYHYIKVEGFEVKNDLWVYSLYQHKPEHLFFPSLHAVAGHAASYRIDHSVVVGMGGGINIIKNSPTKYFQIHLHASYLNFKFENENSLKSFALESLLRLNIPVNPHLKFRWELGSYHAIKKTGFWGGGNLFELLFMLRKNLSANISHQTYYNHQSANNIEKLNTQMLFGFQYLFHK